MADRVKLPVWGTTAHTYRFFWAERRQFWLLAVPAIAVVSLLSALAEWSVAAAAAERIDILIERPRFQELPLSAIMLSALATIAGIWAYVCYSVAWHRSYLVPGENVTIGSCYQWNRRQWRFLWALVKIAIIMALAWMLILVAFAMATGVGAGGVGGFGMASIGPAAMIAMLAAFLLLGAAYARLTVLLPAAAVDEALSVGQVWALTRGNGWRLLGIIILVSIPIGIILIPVAVLLGFAAVSAPNYGPLTSALIQNLLVQFLSYVYIAVGISALSVCFARLAAADNVSG